MSTARVATLALLVAIAACGDKSPKGPPPAGGGRPAEPAGGAPAPAPGPAPAAAPSPEALRAAEERKAREKELVAKAKAAETALEEILGRQRKERESLGDLDPLRKRFRDLKSEYRQKHGEVVFLEAEVQKLKGTSDTGLHPKLVELRKERDKLDQELEKAVLARRDEQARIGAGAVEESPVAKDIRSLREVVDRWLESTRLARARALKPEEKRDLNGTFLKWVKSDAHRAEVVDEVLAQPLAGGKSRADAYDFSAFDFFVLCKSHEHELDKRNIVVQRREGAEFLQRIEELETQKGKVEGEIEKVKEEAGDLDRYDSMLKKLNQARSIEEHIGGQLSALQETLAPSREMEERHAQELAASEKAIETAKGELAALRAEMKKAAGA